MLRENLNNQKLFIHFKYHIKIVNKYNLVKNFFKINQSTFIQNPALLIYT